MEFYEHLYKKTTKTHKEHTQTHKTQKHQEIISKKFADPTNFNHLITKNLTNITCPFPLKLINKVALEQGLRFAIREGGRTVGAGQVTEILD